MTRWCPSLNAWHGQAAGGPPLWTVCPCGGLENLPPRTVIAQEPEAGIQLQKGTQINLVLSVPEQPLAIVRVPQFAGRTLEEAEPVRTRDGRVYPAKLMGTDPSPLTGQQMDIAIRELPRDPDTVGLYKILADHGPLPPR